MRKVCIFTSTRAEWGLLLRVAKQVRDSEALDIQLLISGTHLSDYHGMTVKEIEKAGFYADECIDILKFDDSALGVCKTMGIALAGYGEALWRIQPDILVVLGDRYETFCATVAAQVLRIPVAHIHGGETTEGAIDEAFRHSITKMAHLHFSSCEEHRLRIIQLGESPSRVFNVGSLGIENIRTMQLMSRKQLESSIGFKLNQPFLLITFHPVSLEKATSAKQFERLTGALERFFDHKLIFTGANADAEGQIINEKIAAYAAKHPNRCLSVTSLGVKRYLSALKFCDAVVGNSSSGLLEAPVFGIPTVNIGNRQKGRIRPPSIIDCEPTCEAITSAIKKALTPEFREKLIGLKHPCEKHSTATRIVDKLEHFNMDGLIMKSFYNLPAVGERYAC